MKLKRSLICIAIFFLILLGCGHNDSTPSNPTPPALNRTGIYRLSSASGNYVYQNGIISFDLATSITGTLILGEQSWDEIYMVDGTGYSKNGTYSISYNNDVEGTIGMIYQNGVDSYSFSIDGYNLNLTGAPNAKWTKICNQVNY